MRRAILVLPADWMKLSIDLRRSLLMPSWRMVPRPHLVTCMDVTGTHGRDIIIPRLVDGK
jgi:hypothetical protein